MRLVAGLMAHNELDRYLKWSLPQLLDFCHRVVVVDDASDDGTFEWLASLRDERIKAIRNPEREFFQHEGRARQKLMRAVLEERPTHILATDADEFLSSPQTVWQAVVEHWEGTRRDEFRVWTLPMQEVWKADDHQLWLRVDGGWRSHGVPVLYSVPPGWGRKMTIADRALACGRQPEIVNRAALSRKAIPLDAQVLHFGWTRESERAKRYERYAVADGGKFHRNQHLESIMFPDNRVRFDRREWPSSMLGIKADVLRKVNS